MATNRGVRVRYFSLLPLEAFESLITYTISSKRICAVMIRRNIESG